MKTNWKKVKKGTPVLFRRSKDLEYEEAKWCGGYASYGTGSGAFCWLLGYVSGDRYRIIGARVDPKTGEWHIDPFWCKLAVTEKTKDKHVFVITDVYKRVWHLPMQAVFDDWLEYEADYRNIKHAEMLAIVKEGKAEYDIETWMAEQIYADVLKRKAILVKDLTDKQKIALAEKIMTPHHNDQIRDEHKVKWPSRAALRSFDKLLKGN